MLEKFLRQEFDLNPSKPTHATMKISSNKLSANAVAIHSMLSNSRQGLLGLSVQLVIFITITNINVITPVNPGSQLNMPTNASTRAALVS